MGDGGLVTIVTDVTELKKQEAELQRLRTATDLSSVGSMIWDKDDRLIYANRFVKEHNKEVHGVEIEEGITYSDFARSLMDKGALVVPDDTTLDDGKATKKPSINNVSARWREMNPKALRDN